MSVTIDELESKAQELSIKERSQLISRLIASLEGEPDGTLEEVAAAWDREIEGRIDDMEAGRGEWLSHEQVMDAVRAKIEAARAK